VTETATTESTAPTGPVFKDEMHKGAYDQLAGFIAQRNELVGMANAAQGDRVTLTEQITENATDPEIVAAREARDEAVARLDELVKPQVEKVMANASGELSNIEEKIKTLDSTLKPGLSYFKKVYGDAAAEALPAQARLKGMKVGSGGVGRRIRGYVVDVTVDEETERFENFASAAKYLEVDTSLLQEAFFTAAGNPAQLKDAPNNVVFSVTFTEVDEDGNKSENSADITAIREAAEDAANEAASDSDDDTDGNDPGEVVEPEEISDEDEQSEGVTL